MTNVALRKLLSLVALIYVCPTLAADRLVHGMWVWKTPTVLETPGSAEALRDYCQSQNVNEVYLSISPRNFADLEGRLPQVINVLHVANIRAEALLDSIDADEPGLPRARMVKQASDIAQFNSRHPESRFDGIHLDIEPQQRPESKGPGNLQYLPALIETYRAVRSVAEAAQMTTNADIPNKLLKGNLEQRRMLLTSVPRVTLMLYEISNPADGKTTQQKVDRIKQLSHGYLTMAYADLKVPDLARMAIALRTPDFLELLPEMLNTLDPAHQNDAHYLGWALHSYNEQLKSP